MDHSTPDPGLDPGSFRDPDHRVFRHEGEVFHGLSARAAEDWARLSASPLLDRLQRDGLLIPTEEVELPAGAPAPAGGWAAVLRHEPVPLVSYAYEWPFEMLRDAARLYLDVTLAALGEGLILRDAGSETIQWLGVEPRFVDVACFTPCGSATTWRGYAPFCRQFLYPLMVQAYRDVPFHPWLRGRLDGIHPDECRALLSTRDYLRRGVLADVCRPARARTRDEGRARADRSGPTALGPGVGAITSAVRRLRRVVDGLTWEPRAGAETPFAVGFDEEDLRRSANFVRRVLAPRRWRLVWDLGAHPTASSRLAAEHAEYVLTLEADHVAVNAVYQDLKADGVGRVLPLVWDVADPSPVLGWRGRARGGLEDRGAPELVLALGGVHDLVLRRDIPLSDLVAWVAGLGADLVIEFVGRDDPDVERLLRGRTSPPGDYSAEALELALARHFDQVTHEAIGSGARTLYHAAGPVRRT